MENSKLYKRIMQEEDMFPRLFTNSEKRSYGILFFNEANKESYDSNHAVIFKDQVENLDEVLEDITSFYKQKGIQPSIYQATMDEHYFMENEAVFNRNHYNVWVEGPLEYMTLTAENKIVANPDFEVKLEKEWDKRFEEVFLAAEEPWEIQVAKQIFMSENGRGFVAYYEKKPVGIWYCHIAEGICRYDYILVAKAYRKAGCARAIMSVVTDYCRDQDIATCYQWPAHKTSERLCEESGFRKIFTKEAGRASFRGEESYSKESRI